jgi:Pectate lyase superfamily protein
MTRWTSVLHGALLAIWLTSNAAFAVQPLLSSDFPADGDEFVGPFPSWLNVKTAYGAVGDGVADDTRAIQRALDQLGGADTRSPVLYFPSGTYRITSTLTLSFRVYVSLVGEDPETTTIAWDGGSGGTMLLVNGVAYSRVTRFTFNGNRRAAVAVEQSWDGTQPHFDTGNEYSDSRFIDVGFGIHGGFKDRGFAETSILRSRFVRNSKAGVALGNFNALDIWIWQSLFEDCNVGVTNDPGAGNYHVYQSVFRRSTTADLYMRNTGGFSARDNYSSRSAAFFLSPAINHPATVDIQRNTIVNPTGSTPIRLGNQGPGLVVDNTIISTAQAAGPAVSWRSLFGSDVVSIGNTLTMRTPLSVSGRLVSFDDRSITRPAQMPVEPILPPPRPNLRRTVFEVPRDADSATIQRAIDAATARANRSVVHFPFGVYPIDRTLTVSPGDVQLVGDGMSTTLRWSGARAGPVVHIAGPSRATLRELQVHGNSTVDAIVLHDVDQPGSRVSLNGVELREAETHSLLVRDLAEADVQLIDVGHAQAKGASFRVDGGQVTVFSGASSNNWLSYDITGGARVIVRDIWYEGSAAGGFAAIHGRANFTMQGSRVATTGAHPPSFDLRDLEGRVTVLTTTLDDRIVSTGNGERGNFLGLGILRDPRSPSYFSSSNVPAGRALLVNGRQQVEPGGLLNPGSRLVSDIGILDPDFIRTMLADTRANTGPTLNALTPGKSDVRLFRVWVSRGLTNLTIAGGPP